MEIVIIVLGTNWLDVVPVLKVLSIFGILRAFIVSITPLYISIKKQKHLASITLINLVIMLLTIVPLIIKFGIVGAGYSIILASLLTLVLIISNLIEVF